MRKLSAKASVEYRFMTKGERVFLGVNSFFLFLIFLITFYPLLYVLAASFSSSDAVISGQVFIWPVDFNLDAYIEVFKHKQVMMGYKNTIFYTLVGTAVNVVLTIAAAYPLSRPDFKARNFFMFLITFTMLFSGGMIPTYLVVNSMGLVNTRWAMIIPGAISAYNVIITRTYFQSTIPTEMLEAAQLDGCTNMNFILKMVIPLSGAIIAVISLYYAVGHWNAYFNALIYLYDREKYPLQVFLREILILNQMSVDNTAVDLEFAMRQEKLMELLKYALIVVASFPVLCIYPFIQKFFVKGVMIGSVKG